MNASMSHGLAGHAHTHMDTGRVRACGAGGRACMGNASRHDYGTLWVMYRVSGGQWCVYRNEGLAGASGTWA